MSNRTMDLRIAHKNAFELVANANSQRVTHDFVQVNPLDSNVLVLLWQPAMDLPGHGDLYITLNGDGTWCPSLTVPFVPVEEQD